MAVRVAGVCLLGDCDIGPTANLFQMPGPFEYELKCEYRSRAIGYLEWCTYFGQCGALAEDDYPHITEAAKHSKFWRR